MNLFLSLIIFLFATFGINKAIACDSDKLTSEELSEAFFIKSEDPEIAVIQELLFTTKKNLNSQKELLQNLIDFKETRKAFTETPTSGKLATKLVRLSMRLHKQMDEDHLAHLFQAEFLNEIKFFNQVGESQKIARE